jgi:hypothetical protein
MASRIGPKIIQAHRALTLSDISRTSEILSDRTQSGPDTVNIKLKKEEKTRHSRTARSEGENISMKKPM